MKKLYRGSYIDASGQMEPNLAVSIYVRSSINVSISFRSTNKYGHQGQFLFLIGYCLKKSSPLKLLGKMEPILAGSIYVRSSITSLVPFGQVVSEEKIKI
jgi:hypothetical protein